MIKLLMFVPSFRGGGAERVFVNLANYFYKRGVEVHFVVTSDEGPNKILLEKSINVISLNKKSVYLSVLDLTLLVRKIRPDIIFSTMMSCNIVSILARFFSMTSAKVIIREANIIPKRVSVIDRAKDLISKYIYPFCDRIILNSPDTFEDIKNLVGYKIIPKGVVIGNPVLPNEIIKSYDSFVKPKQNNKIIKIVSVGRLVKQKNYKLAFDVVKVFQDFNIPVIYDIYGEGPLQNDLVDYCSSIGISSSVNFKGFSENIKKILPYYDVFLLTSLWEGFGNVIVESLAAGLPVVLTDCPGGPRFIVESDDIGSICTFCPEEIFDMINLQIQLDNPERVLQRKLRANDFTIETSGEKYFNEIFGLL
ncbi:glycosyltransferase [Shewanella basaltis]|uniref:glycosyltransferase n=1 Tax=Shewanella basaltis TaxID=472183 RepID=UPI00200F12E3|nr:glycosyltransferase [Shewanella basaltis]MCL1112986.1 glycosyltransferase [Shewanella basaltis]